ncbi:MAG: threonine synthase, partial [Duncaniella sp.]|nr:threonine synthase [Duncaniella sp.]
MKYYSTNHNVPEATLQEAVVKGLASDRGLFMPERIERMPAGFFEDIDKMSFHEIAVCVARCFFGEDVERDALEDIV